MGKILNAFILFFIEKTMKSARIFYTCLVLWISISAILCIEDVEFFPSSGEYIKNTPKCDSKDVTEWSIDFHNCFIKKKIEDGGRNLESIVERILGHAEACVETSSKDCRPEFDGFKKILSKVLEQMKDFSDMYLQEIHSGRENIKDLKCIEEILSLNVYHDCFKDYSNTIDQNENEFKSTVKAGIRCTNKQNIECSREARSSLNRVVRIIYGLKQPPEEEKMDEIQKPPPPKQWYEYITSPIVTAWEAVKNFFSGIFG